MADDLDTGAQAEPAQGSDDSGKVQDPPKKQDKGSDKPFTPEQEAYVGSWLGRIVKNQFEESIIPLIKENMPQPRPKSLRENNDVLKEFNEKISEKLFSDPVGAIQEVMSALDASKVQLTKAQSAQVDKAITSFSEEPLYKDIYSDIKKIAHERVSSGYPPDAAADYAFTRAKLEYLEKKNNPDGEGGLNLSEGGKSVRRGKTPSLPPEFKRAFERDKAKGLFKSEAEYIEGLSPAIRAKYGI